MKCVSFRSLPFIFIFFMLFIIYYFFDIIFPYNRIKRMSKPIVLLWTPFFGKKNYITPEKIGLCPYVCKFTSDKRYLLKSDAIIFHANDLSSDLPKKLPNQIWIFLNHEAPPNTHGDLNILNNKINWTVTYRLESEIVLSPSVTRRRVILPQENFTHNKKFSIAWLVSNCNTSSQRELYVRELQKYIDVHIYGNCGLFKCLPKLSDQCYKNLSKHYYFYLAFENSLCKDYVTEKLFNSLNYYWIPIVFGKADYNKFAPPYSVIDALSFSNPFYLAKYLRYLIKKPDKYNEYFNWKMEYKFHLISYPCQICIKLYTFQTHKTWTNLNDWWFKEAECMKWSPIKNTVTFLEQYRPDNY